MATALGVIEAWGLTIKQDATEVYLSNNRDRYFETLIEQLLHYRIDYDSAKSRVAVNAVIDRLVTKEGKKGNGKHKGWKEQVEMEYKALLLTSYPHEDVANPNLQAKPIEFNSLIDLWGEYYYGQMYDGLIREYANTPGHYINMKFNAEVIDSDWPRSLNQVPEWVQVAIEKGQLTTV